MSDPREFFELSVACDSEKAPDEIIASYDQGSGLPSALAASGIATDQLLQYQIAHIESEGGPHWVEEHQKYKAEKRPQLERRMVMSLEVNEQEPTYQPNRARIEQTPTMRVLSANNPTQ
jgi:hypothetical protein